jgi:hypothetical protein
MSAAYWQIFAILDKQNGIDYKPLKDDDESELHLKTQSVPRSKHTASRL